MSATEIMREIEKLPDNEQQELFVLLTRRVLSAQSPATKRWLGKRLSFEEACDVVFRENRELLSALAKGVNRNSFRWMEYFAYTLAASKSMAAAAECETRG